MISKEKIKEAMLSAQSFMLDPACVMRMESLIMRLDEGEFNEPEPKCNECGEALYFKPVCTNIKCDTFFD